MDAQFSRCNIVGLENKRPAEFIKRIMSELKTIQYLREDTWRQMGKGNTLPRHLQVVREATCFFVTRYLFPCTWSCHTKLPVSLYTFGDKHDRRVQELSYVIKFFATESESCAVSDKMPALSSVAAGKNVVRGTGKVSNLGIPSSSTAPDPCVPSASAVSTRSDIACSSKETANTHVNNEIPYSDSDISFLSKHDDESKDKNSLQYKHKLIEDTLETRYKRIRKKLGINAHDSDKKACSTDESTSTRSNSNWIKYMDEYPALISKLIGKENNVSTSAVIKKDYSTDRSTATTPKSKWIKHLVEYPALMEKLIGNESKVKLLMSAGNCDFAGFPDVKPIFPDEKIIFDSEGRPIIDLVNESDKSFQNASELDKKI